MRFFRQEYWSELSFPSPEDLPNPGIERRSPTLQTDSFFFFFCINKLFYFNNTFFFILIIHFKAQHNYVSFMSHSSLMSTELISETHLLGLGKTDSFLIYFLYFLSEPPGKPLLEYSSFKMCVSLCCKTKWISHTHTYIHSLLDSLPILLITEYWEEFSVLQ